MSSKHDRSRMGRAAAIAFLVELALFGGGYRLLTRKPPAPVEPPVTVISLAPAPEPTPAPAPAPAPAAAPTPAKPPPRVEHAATPPHHAARIPTPAPPAVPAQPAPPVPATPAAPATSAAAPTEAPATPPHPPVASPAPSASASPNASFEGALRAAIEAALRYPESARMSGMTGRTRVAFDYRDGTVSNVKVVIASGMGLLDRAALAAVLEAACPKPEPAFAGKTVPEQVWVTFKLDNPE